MGNFKKSYFLDVVFTEGEVKTYPFGTMHGVENALRNLTKLYSPADVKKIEVRISYFISGEI